LQPRHFDEGMGDFKFIGRSAVEFAAGAPFFLPSALGLGGRLELKLPANVTFR
jgi:hypothetical protein